MQSGFDSPKFAASHYQNKYFERKNFEQPFSNHEHQQMSEQQEEINFRRKDEPRNRTGLSELYQEQLDPLSLQLPSFRSPDANARSFTFTSPSSKALQLKQYLEQEQHPIMNGKKSELLLNRSTSTRNRREPNNPRNSSSNRKEISSWLADMFMP